MNRNQVLPQVELSADLSALRRVDFCAPQSYFGRGFLAIPDLPRLAQEASKVEVGDGFEWVVKTYFVDSPGSEPHQILQLGLKGRLQMICQRCLQDCPVDLSEERQFVMVATEALADAYPISEERQFVMVATEALADAYPIEDDELEPIVASQHFDLLSLIEDEILLSLPLIPKHPEGACQAHASSFGDAKTGADALEKPENPFNILKNMKKSS
ncbi:MAG: hypothetical protein B7Y55_13195 [Polynucleobacter sp. 35-46-207]|nr:MAG: hypothetical protein B7Y55_13195 [Polynucleobacter sp. 35-46-207]